MGRRLLGVVGIVIGGVLSAGGMTGCATPSTDTVTAQPQPVDQASLTAAGRHRIVAIGEATHGNHELVALRSTLIQRLATEQGFRTFALEADFGGAEMVNDYVLGGPGTAADAARDLGYDIYATTEMADLIEAVRDHNDASPDPDRIRFTGFDLQRYDHNKTRLLRYLAAVDPETATTATAALADLTDAGRNNLDAATVTRAQTAIGALLEALSRDHRRYVARSSEPAYADAVHHLRTIDGTTRLRQSVGTQYGELRDRLMAENVSWIVDREAAAGRTKIMIGGHVGHVEKTGAAYPSPSMGELLTARYGEDYFVIGTDFGSSTFLSRSGNGRSEFTVRHRSTLAGMFGDQPAGYVDLATAGTSASNAALLDAPVKMGMVGDEFSWYGRFLPSMFTVSVVPSKAYDALIFVAEATPATPL